MSYGSRNMCVIVVEKFYIMRGEMWDSSRNVYSMEGKTWDCSRNMYGIEREMWGCSRKHVWYQRSNVGI